jgi:hypothetical protein
MEAEAANIYLRSLNLDAAPYHYRTRHKVAQKGTKVTTDQQFLFWDIRA